MGHVLDSRVELQLELCFGAELLLQDARQLGLLALHPIGMIGHVGDGIEIELRQHTVARAAILELRRNQALRDQRGRGAEPIEHVERGRMERRGARLLAQIGPRLEHRHRQTGVHQVGRRHQTDRPGT